MLINTSTYKNLSINYDKYLNVCAGKTSAFRKCNLVKL